MSISLFNDARINVLSQALTGLAQRQQAIAGNIANVDTPGYQRKDVNFESQLRAELGIDSGVGMATTAQSHLAGAGSAPGLLDTAAGGSGGASPNKRNDGNNVDIDYEMAQLSQTTLQYETLTQATQTSFNTLNGIVTRLS
jgi:flagellar basal-body rod protein FlgB